MNIKQNTGQCNTVSPSCVLNEAVYLCKENTWSCHETFSHAHVYFQVLCSINFPLFDHSIKMFIYIQSCITIYRSVYLYIYIHRHAHIYLYIYIGTLHKIFALMTFSIKNYLLFFLSYSIATSISKASSAGASVHAVVYLGFFNQPCFSGEFWKHFFYFSL